MSELINKATTASFGYRPCLDGLRAVAVLAVMVFHAGVGIGAFRILPGGRGGVVVFFALSGFLITAILLKEFHNNGRISLKAFYKRRALRLIPALLFLLVVFNIYTTFFEPKDLSRQSYWFSLAAVFYVSNWLRVIPYGHPALNHLWTLSIEEQFYLLWPALLIVMLKLKLTCGQIATLIGIIIIVSPFYRLFLWQKPGSLYYVYNAFDTRAETLLVGCALALVRYDKLPSRLMKVVGMVSAAVLFVTFLIGSDRIELIFGISVIGYATVGIIAAALQNPASAAVKFLEWRPLVWTGKLSYSLYLWHLPVFYVVGWSPMWHGKAYPMFAFVLSFVFASISYYLIEQPFLRLKEKFSVEQGPVQLAAATGD